MDILWLGESECHDLQCVGGKAANLSRLAARYRVPPGFCVTTVAYDRAGGSTMPADLRDLIVQAYRDLGERTATPAPSVAVRSSAVDEDGTSASFAGQHDTYLNVVGAESVAEAVARCWQSAQGERALEYRRQQRLSVDGIRLAVLVQQLVTADVSAVVFSANPLTGRRDQVVINASWGLGESIVSGTVTPDTYVVLKSDRSVIERRVADKARMTVPVADGTDEVDVPRFLRSQPAIDDATIRQMTDLATSLEEDMGWPVDVECAVRAGTLFLLQCRPITTLGDR